MNRPILLTQNDSKACRICLDNDNQNDLISPCLCTGGSAYVHRKCLDNWRSVNKDGRAFKFCEVCKFEYVIEPVVDDPVADRKRQLIFRLLVTRDVSLIILLVQALIVGFAFLLQAADKNKHSIRNLYPHSMSSFGVYYLSSLILFFALVGLFGMIGACCGMLSGNNERGDRDCACYSCMCVGSDCNGCNGGDGEGALIIVLVVIVFFAILGVFVGIIMGIYIIRLILKHHTNKLWLKQETKKYVVKDFQGRTNELRNTSSRQHNTTSVMNNMMQSNRPTTKPSAPIELLKVTALNSQ